MRTSMLVRRAGVSRDTLRYYERIGAITPPGRTASGYREYTEATLAELRFVRLAKSVGLPLRAIVRAIPYLAAPVPGCPELRAVLEQRLAALDAQLVRLQAARSRLVKWLATNRAEARARARGGRSSAGAARVSRAARSG